jgi:hypothetical protein
MNRHERRAAKKPLGSVTFIDCGRLLEADPNYGEPVICCACGAPHNASGIAQIRHNHNTTFVPLCEPCLEANPTDQIMRRYWNSPDLTISDGGEATTEQVLAMAEAQRATKQ